MGGRSARTRDRARARSAAAASGGRLRPAPGLAGPHQGVRRRAQARSGSELPHRRQHPGRDPGAAGVRPGRRGAGGRRRSGCAHGGPGRGGRRTCTPSRSTGAWKAPLEATLAGRPTVQSALSGRAQGATGRARAAPTLCASNLPYSVAGPFIIESLQRLPSVRRYCVMVQREVAERMAAAPGHQGLRRRSRCGCSSTPRSCAARPLARSIFYPQPHVDSSLVVLERLPPGELPTCDRAAAGGHPGCLRPAAQDPGQRAQRGLGLSRSGRWSW